MVLRVFILLSQPAGRLAGRQADRQAGRQAGRQVGRQADRQTGRQADRRTGRQTGRQVGRHVGRQGERRLNCCSAVISSEEMPSRSKTSILVVFCLVFCLPLISRSSPLSFSLSFTLLTSSPLLQDRISLENWALLASQSPRLAKEVPWVHSTGGPEAGGILIAAPSTVSEPAGADARPGQPGAWGICQCTQDDSFAWL